VPDSDQTTPPPAAPGTTMVTLTLGDTIFQIHLKESGMHTWRSLQEAFPRAI